MFQHKVQELVEHDPPRVLRGAHRAAAARRPGLRARHRQRGRILYVNL